MNITSKKTQVQKMRAMTVVKAKENVYNVTRSRNIYIFRLMMTSRCHSFRILDIGIGGKVRLVTERESSDRYANAMRKLSITHIAIKEAQTLGGFNSETGCLS